MKKHHSLLLQNIHQGQSCHLFALQLPIDFCFIYGPYPKPMCFCQQHTVQAKDYHKHFDTGVVHSQHILLCFDFYLGTMSLQYFRINEYVLVWIALNYGIGARKSNCIDAVISTTSLKDHFYPLTIHPFLLSRNCMITLSTRHIRCL